MKLIIAIIILYLLTKYAKNFTKNKKEEFEIRREISRIKAEECHQKRMEALRKELNELNAAIVKPTEEETKIYERMTTQAIL